MCFHRTCWMKAQKLSVSSPEQASSWSDRSYVPCDTIVWITSFPMYLATLNTFFAFATTTTSHCSMLGISHFPNWAIWSLYMLDKQDRCFVVEAVGRLILQAYAPWGVALGNDSNHDVGHRFTRQCHRFVVLNGTPQAVLCPGLLVAFGHEKTLSVGWMVNFPSVRGGLAELGKAILKHRTKIHMTL